MAWRERQWNEPDRHDWYVMQVAAEIVRGRLVDPKAVSVGDFKLNLTRVDDAPKPPKPLTQEEIEVRTAMAKARWNIRLGKFKVKHG
jgi:hypothetical protein